MRGYRPPNRPTEKHIPVGDLTDIIKRLDGVLDKVAEQRKTLRTLRLRYAKMTTKLP
jgi:hypothetical protein